MKYLISFIIASAEAEEKGLAGEDAPSLPVVDTPFITIELDVGDHDIGVGALDLALVWNVSFDGWSIIGHAVHICVVTEGDVVLWVAHPDLHIGAVRVAVLGVALVESEVE